MVLDLLLIAVAITLDPLPIMAFVLVLSSYRGVWRGLAFILAWLACLVAVIALVLLFTGGQPPPPRSPPSTAALAAKLAIGVGLVLYGAHRRRVHRAPQAATEAKGRAEHASDPHGGTGRMSPWSAAALAVFLQPWGLVAAAATVVVRADLSHFASFAALFGFVLLATGSLLAAELYTVFAPEAAGVRLARLRSWLQEHQEPAIVVGCLVLGLWLTGNSIYQLTS
ncbi:GAP family protein [Streptomyces sp. ICN441]|uniref:GAP family protein n=1 Tax=Streptomyces sp. ICN441 TaxID=2558286 RepID=UPI00106AFCE9|nr:GAP family protein [Streptomyces sp. ICN441]TFE49868.1 GAP family protein [Streptomyces sp. ICN441]